MENSTFALTDEQRQFQATLRQFAEERVAPHAAQVDRDAEYPWDSFKACVELELPSLGIPVAYGGAGADMVTQAIVAEELARVCASTSLTILISKLGMLPVMNWGSEELKQQYLPRVATGEIQASYCLSEADAGSDVAAMRTRAVRDGDDYILTGSKYWITNAGISDVYIVFAKTDPDAGGRGISCFLVEKEWGITIAKHEDKLGMRGSPTGEVVLDEVRVPASHRIGEEGQGFTIAMHTLDRSRPTIGAQAVGIAQGAIDYSAAYMKQRHAFGGPIADMQGLRFMLADMAMRNEAARALVYRACAMVDHDPAGELTIFGAMAKAFASDTVHAGDHRCRPAPRWLRLHQGLPGRALPARRQGDPDLRRHQPGPEGGHLPGAAQGVLGGHMSDVSGTEDTPTDGGSDFSNYPPPPTAPPPPPAYGYTPYQAAPPPPSFGPTPRPLAGYGARLGGWLIDWLLLAVVTTPILIVTHTFHHTHSLVNVDGRFVHQTNFNVGAAGIAIQAVIVIVYGAFLCGSPNGQTVGMMATGIRVIDESTGESIGFARAFGRGAFEYLMTIVFFIPWIIDMLFPLWDPKNQTLHDKVTRSVVIKR